jgi:hypothetical protein
MYRSGRIEHRAEDSLTSWLTVWLWVLLAIAVIAAVGPR